MQVTRYRPAFFTGFDYECADVDTLDQLLHIPWVYSWTEFDNFYQMSVSDGRLMAEFDEGRKWYVIATLDGTNTFGLPEFQPVR